MEGPEEFPKGRVLEGKCATEVKEEAGERGGPQVSREGSCPEARGTQTLPQALTTKPGTLSIQALGYSIAFSGHLSSKTQNLGKLSPYCWDFPGGTVVKNPPANAGDRGSIPGLGRSHMSQSN